MAMTFFIIEQAKGHHLYIAVVMHTEKKTSVTKLQTLPEWPLISISSVWKEKSHT